MGADLRATKAYELWGDSDHHTGSLPHKLMSNRGVSGPSCVPDIRQEPCLLLSEEVKSLDSTIRMLTCKI